MAQRERTAFQVRERDAAARFAVPLALRDPPLYTRRMIAFALACLLAQAAPPGPSSAPARSWQTVFDELWMRRDARGAEQELQRIVDRQLSEDPRSFEANWRLSALLNWEANAPGLDGDAKAALARKAWDAAEKAVAARPDDVRGHYNAAVGIGLYSEGAGIISALSQGLEGKFRDHAQAALRIDKDYLDGAPQVLWGRYFFKLPWPKRDVGQATRILTEAVRTHPNNLRAKLFLADCYADEDHIAEGKQLAQQVLAARNAEDAPDEKRVKAQAHNWIEAHGPPNTAF